MIFFSCSVLVPRKHWAFVSWPEKRMSTLLRETGACESYGPDLEGQMMKGWARNYKETVFSLFRIYSETGVLNSGITTKKQTPWWQAETAHQNSGASHFSLLLCVFLWNMTLCCKIWRPRWPRDASQGWEEVIGNVRKREDGHGTGSVCFFR